MRNKLPDWLIVLLLLALPLLYFAPVTLGGQTMLPADTLYTFEPWRAAAVAQGVGTPYNALIGDLVLENYAWQSFINRSLTAGTLPLWNPHNFAGVPFLAAGQHSLLYPFSLIFRILPLSLAYGWFSVSQLFLAGLFMYLFMRGLGTGRTGSVIAAVVYQLCGFYLANAVFTMVIAGAAWLPLILLMAEHIIRQQAIMQRPCTIPWVVGGIGALGMVALAGHPEVLMYTVLVVAFYALARLGMVTRAQHNLGVTLRPLIALAVMGLFGLALGGLQLVPMVEALRDNFREGAAGFGQVRGWALPTRRLLTFAMPNFYGNPTHHSYYDLFSRQTIPAPMQTIDWGMKNYVEGAAYLGILTLALALVGARARSRSHVRGIFIALALLALSFMFGTPTYALIYYGLPGASQLHTPFRWVWPFTLSVAVLAGLGTDAVRHMWSARAAADVLTRSEWGKGDAPGEATWRVLLWTERVLLAGGVLLIAALMLSRMFFGRLEPLIDKLVQSLARATHAFNGARMFYCYEFRQVFIFAVFLLGAGVALHLARGRRTLSIWTWRVPVWKPVALALIAADLLIASWGLYPANDPDLLDFRPPVVDFLAAQEGDWRMVTLEEPGAATFNANTPSYYGFDDVRGYDSIIQGQYTRYMALIYPQVQLAFNRVAPIFTDQAQALDSPLLDLLNVRFVVTEEEIDNPRYTEVYADAGVRVYENQGVMPRAFTLPREAYVCVADFAEAIHWFDVRQYAIFTPEDLQAGACWPDVSIERWTASTPTPADITARGNNTVMVDVDIDTPSYLILTDSYYPGWKAFVRPQGAGKDTEQAVIIERVDGNFRAVYLDTPGAWTVRFRYSPDSIKVGGFASFLALVVMMFMLGVWLWRLFYRSERERADASGVVTMARNSLAPIFIQLFNRAIDFGFAFIMLRILAPEGAGKYYYAIVIFGWFDILTNFGLNTLLTREVARSRERANRYLYNSSVLRLMLAALGAPLLALFIFGRQAAFSPPLASDTVLAIVLLYIGLIPNSLATGLTALFNAYEKAEYPAAIATIATMLKAALGIIVLILGFGVVGLAGASIVTNLVTLSILAYLGRKFFFRPRREPDAYLRRDMLRASWPLMLNHLLATIFFKVDVTLLEVLRGAATVGRYSVAYKWLDTLNVIPAFLTMGIFPAMARQAKEDPQGLMRHYRLTVKLLVMLALPVAVLTTFTAKWLIMLLGGSAYLPDGAVALQIMIWSIPIGWINSVTQYVLIALDKQRMLMRAFVAGVGFNLAANLIFMPSYGYRAAATITILSELVLLVAFYWLLRRTLGGLPWFLMLWRPVTATALMGAVILILGRLVPLPLALMAGALIYLGALWALKPLTEDEVVLLMPLLPARMRAEGPPHEV